MKSLRLWLGLAALTWFAITLGAAPAPEPESQGPISDALRMREKLPKTAPPRVTTAQMRNETIEMEMQTTVTVPVAVQEKVMDGGVEKVVTVVRYQQVIQSYRVAAAAKKCKFYSITKDGKLEAVEADKAATQLKKKTAVLVGDSLEIDARYLEQVKPGTLYLMVPRTEPRPFHDEKQLPK